MKKLVIVAREYSRTQEADEIFEQRNWRPVRDNSIIPKTKRVVDRGRHSTPLIELEWKEIEYGNE